MHSGKEAAGIKLGMCMCVNTDVVRPEESARSDNSTPDFCFSLHLMQKLPDLYPHCIVEIVVTHE